MKIAVVLKGLAVNKTALFPRSNSASVRDCIYRLQDKGIGKFTTQKRDNCFAVTRLMMEVPDAIIDRFMDLIQESEEEESEYKEFSENGIDYVVEYSINRDEDYFSEDSGHDFYGVRKSWKLSISGFFNEIQISDFENEYCEIIKL